jgi:hypothetical protein
MIRSLRALILVGTMATSVGAALPSSAYAATPWSLYPASQSYVGRPKPVKFSSHRISEALTPEYKAIVRDEVSKGPNFAGAYTLVTVGCGTACETVLVIRAFDGRIFALPEAATYGVRFRAHSRLIVLRYDPAHKIATQHFVFDNGTFRRVAVRS